MDLAPRTLLCERGHTVDLYAPGHVARLFAGDAWFRRALCRPEDIDPGDYDAAIVMSHQRRSLALKGARLRRLPWVTLHGYYGGADFHRARFATQRLADLLSVRLRDGDFARHSAQKLQLDGAAGHRAAVLCPRVGSVALAIGGRWQDRTYAHWQGVISLLHARGVRDVVLLGDDSARPAAAALVSRAPAHAGLLDLVGQTTLAEAQAVIGRAAVAVCADGGLMHLALTTATPVVALFNASIDPQWRLPVLMRGEAIRSATPQVSDIAPEDVARAVVHRLGTGLVPDTWPRNVPA